MSNKADRAAFAPAQATAAIAALDFTAASEALASAFAAAKAMKGEAATETAAEAIAERADRLLSLPTANPAQIAEKVSAFAWLHNHTPQPFSDRDTRLRIADTGSDAAKGLLAIYLDLTAAAPVVATMEERGEGQSIAGPRAAWEKALAAHLEAKAKLDALTAKEEGNGEDTSEEWEAASAAVGETLEALLNTRAPDGVAMGLKARFVIEQNHIFYRGDDVSDPAFISGMLADGWDESALAALYQDGLALEGVSGHVVDAQPDTFDGAAWLETVEAETGSRMVRSNDYSPRVHFEGGDADAAKARLATLPPWQADDVETVAYNRARREAYAAAGPAPERIPSSPEELQATFARALVNSTPADQRDRLTAALAACGIVPIVWDDEKEAAR